MPFINVKIIEGVFSPTQKAQIIRKLTDAMVEIEGEAMRPVTWSTYSERTEDATPWASGDSSASSTTWVMP